MKVLVSSLLLLVEFCLLADYFNDSNNNLYQIIVIVSFMICAAIDTLRVCLSSQNIINSMESMINATKRRIAFTYLSSEDYNKAKLILRMRKEIRFSASTLFVVKSTTVLMALSYVANFAVILIQISDKI
jgi:hypothetical protein